MILGGRLRMLVSGLHMASLSLNEEQVVCSDNGVTVPSRRDKEQKIYEIRTAFINRLHINRPWAYWLGVCEAMNFLNLVFQTYVTNEFLGGTFMHLGEDVVETDFTRDMDALDEIFPKVNMAMAFTICSNQLLLYGYLSYKTNSIGKLTLQIDCYLLLCV